MTASKEFMERVEARRKQIKHPIYEFCMHIGSARSAYYKWLDGGRDMGLSTALKISHLIGEPIQQGHEINCDEINHHIHTKLLESEPAYTYIEELLAEGMKVQDVAVAFQTSPKQINKILLINRTSNDNDTYKRKLR